MCFSLRLEIYNFVLTRVVIVADISSNSDSGTQMCPDMFLTLFHQSPYTTSVSLALCVKIKLCLSVGENSSN